MNPLAKPFRDACLTAGKAVGARDGHVMKVFGLADFQLSCIGEDDDATDLAVKAARYFVGNCGSDEAMFMFAVYAVCSFLAFECGGECEPPVGPARDLADICRDGCSEAAVRGWVGTNFPQLPT